MQAKASASAWSALRRISTADCVACDVSKDAEIAGCFDALGKQWGGLDGFVHAIAFAPKEADSWRFPRGLSRESFLMAHDIFLQLCGDGPGCPAVDGRPQCRGAYLVLPSVPERGAQLQHHGTAKASLKPLPVTRREPRRAASVPTPSPPGRSKTLAAAGIGGFGKMLKFFEEQAPLRRNVTQEEVGNGRILMSDLAKCGDWRNTYVDCGFNVIASGMPAG